MLFHSPEKITLKPPQRTNKTTYSVYMAMKLNARSQCGAKLLQVSLVGSSQPCGWLTGKAKQSFKFLPQFLNKSHQTLHPKQCVIRWFSLATVHANKVHSGGLPLNIHGISLQYPSIHALPRNLIKSSLNLIWLSVKEDQSLFLYCKQY